MRVVSDHIACGGRGGGVLERYFSDDVSAIFGSLGGLGGGTGKGGRRTDAERTGFARRLQEIHGLRRVGAWRSGRRCDRHTVVCLGKQRSLYFLRCKKNTRFVFGLRFRVSCCVLRFLAFFLRFLFSFSFSLLSIFFSVSFLCLSTFLEFEISNFNLEF